MEVKVPGAVISAASWAAARAPQPGRRSYWPLWVMGSGCFVAIWAGWVGLGSMAGFGPVQLFPGIWDSFRPNTAITLPLSMEVYGAYALRWWIDRRTPEKAKAYAMWTSISALALGLAGQAGYHLMNARVLEFAARHQVWTAPWPVTVAVAWVPVIAFGLGAGLRHMLNDTEADEPAYRAPRLAYPVALRTSSRIATLLAELPPQAPRPVAPAAQGPAPVDVHVHAAPEGAPWGLVSPAAAPAPSFAAPVRGPFMTLADRPKPAARPRAVPDQNDARLPLPQDPAELRVLVNSMTRNDLYRTYRVSKGGADKLRERYLDQKKEVA